MKLDKVGLALIGVFALFHAVAGICTYYVLTATANKECNPVSSIAFKTIGLAPTLIVESIISVVLLIIGKQQENPCF
jgi:hypothetical protein